MSLHSDDEMVDAKKLREQRLARLNAVRCRRYRRRLRRAKHVANHVAKSVESGAHPITDYDSFVAYMVARRKALGWTQLECDERAGFTAGQTSKLEAWRGPQGRVAGSVTMPRWLAALGVELKPALKRPQKFTGPRLNGAQLAQRVP